MSRFAEAQFFAGCRLRASPPSSGEATVRQTRQRCRMKFNAAQLPTASLTHFLVKLVLAAPASFFSAAWLAQVALASF